jgi:hypothetical protein
MSTETAILRALFPDGLAPIDRLPEIQKSIGNLIRVAQGNVKIADPEVNRVLNEKIVTLKDEKHLTWIRIQEELKPENIFLTIDAIRHRYTGAKRAAKVQAIDKKIEVVGAPAGVATITSEHNETSVNEAVNKAKEYSKVIEARKGPKIPHSFDPYILEQRANDRSFQEIALDLSQKGAVCNRYDAQSRYQILTKAEEGRKIKARAEPVKHEAPKPISVEAPRNKELTDNELDTIIIDLKEGGATNFEISRRIEHDHHVTFTPMEINQRIQGLRARGAI